MADPKTQEEKEAEARVTVRAALLPKTPLAAPEPIREVMTDQLAKLIVRIDELEIKVAALEGR